MQAYGRVGVVVSNNEIAATVTKLIAKQARRLGRQNFVYGVAANGKLKSIGIRKRSAKNDVLDRVRKARSLGSVSD